MENIGSGEAAGYNCDISLVAGHPALHGHRADNNKSFSVNHLLDLPGAGHLYHTHQTLQDSALHEQHRIPHDVKIPEGKVICRKCYSYVLHADL